MKQILSSSVAGKPVPLPVATRQSRAAERLLARMKPDGTAQGWTGGEELDHTACRQIWDAAGLIGTDGENGAAIDQTSDRRKIEKDGHILALCAHRNPAGSIVAFESFYPGVDGEMTCSIAKGGQPTIFIGNDAITASRIVVVERGLEAFEQAWIEKDRSDTAYVSIGGAFGLGTRRALATVCAGKQVIGAFRDPVTAEMFMAELRKIAPTALWLDSEAVEASPDAAEDDHPEPGLTI